MTARVVAAGKQKGHVLCFRRARVIRHEIVDGESVALLPMLATPDHVLTRGTVISDDRLAELRRDYVVCTNGPNTFVDGAGGSYFAIPVALAPVRASVS